MSQFPPTVYWGCWTLHPSPSIRIGSQDPGQAWCRCVEGDGGRGEEGSWMQRGEVEAHVGYEIWECVGWGGQQVLMDGRETMA